MRAHAAGQLVWEDIKIAGIKTAVGNFESSTTGQSREMPTPQQLEKLRDGRRAGQTCW